MSGPHELHTHALMTAVNSVEDPELPVTIADLGMIREIVDNDGELTIRLVPTFLACPARWAIERDVITAVSAVPGVRRCSVDWVDGGWTVSDVTARGRSALADVGVALPAPDGEVACPHCASTDISQLSAFGSAVCRSSAYCNSCRTPFDVFKTRSQRAAVCLPDPHR